MSYICGSSLYVLINIYEKQKQKKHKDLKGGCHNFQYFDHKSSCHWDCWENVKKNSLKNPRKFNLIFLGIEILLRRVVPTTNFLLHFSVPNNQILFFFGVLNKQILLNFGVPNNCSMPTTLMVKILKILTTLLNKFAKKKCVHIGKYLVNMHDKKSRSRKVSIN